MHTKSVARSVDLPMGGSAPWRWYVARPCSPLRSGGGSPGAQLTGVSHNRMPGLLVAPSVLRPDAGWSMAWRRPLLFDDVQTRRNRPPTRDDIRLQSALGRMPADSSRRRCTTLAIEQASRRGGGS